MSDRPFYQTSYAAANVVSLHVHHCMHDVHVMCACVHVHRPHSSHHTRSTDEASAQAHTTAVKQSVPAYPTRHLLYTLSDPATVNPW